MSTTTAHPSPRTYPSAAASNVLHLPSGASMFEQVADVMAAIVAGETDRLGEIEALGTEFQETTTQFQELCAPAE